MAKIVRAKMRCDSIKQTMGGRYRDVQGEQTYVREPEVSLEFQAVTGTSEENSEFWNATPAGSLTLQCVNKDVVEHIEVDGEYYVDIIVPEKEESAETET